MSVEFVEPVTMCVTRHHQSAFPLGHVVVEDVNARPGAVVHAP